MRYVQDLSNADEIAGEAVCGLELSYACVRARELGDVKQGIAGLYDINRPTGDFATGYAGLRRRKADLRCRKAGDDHAVAGDEIFGIKTVVLFKFVGGGIVPVCQAFDRVALLDFDVYPAGRRLHGTPGGR